ncbi:MAG: glycosyltransferase [Victivallales bacterium]|nr:glycosyltransferase [Victivallales bacterium]
MLQNNKYLFFIGVLLNGGAERVVSILVNKMIKSNKNIELLIYYKSKYFYVIDDKVKITIVEEETGTRNILKNIIWVRNYIKNNADVIISFMAAFNMFILIATLGLSKKVIVADRSDPYRIPSNFVIRLLRNILYRFADGVVLQTKHNQDYFSKNIQQKSIVIYNPVDIDKIAQIQLNDFKDDIISVGRLIPVKNQKLLLEVFAEIHKQYPNYSLIIYGEGEEREKLQSLSHALGIESNFFLPGNKKDIFNCMANAKLFVLSSNYEGMPNALLEAMCLGLPVISTKVSGATDLIENGVNGILVDCNNKIELTNAIIKMIKDNDFRVKCAQNALLQRKKFLPDVIIKQWINYINSIENKQ